MKYLGLDLGSKTLGLSVSDNSGIVANNLKVIRHNEEYEKLLNQVVEVVNELKIEAIVLGFPKNMDGSIGSKAQLSLDFKKQLEKYLTIPIYLQDERLSTVSANNVLIDGGMSRKKRKKIVDGVAATIILQTFLDKESR